jgi:hypothetical protein
VDLFWRQAREPLHVAMVELESATRTDERLRATLARLNVTDEQALDLETGAAFPVLAAIGENELKLGRYFVTIFINGLAAHPFPSDAARWQEALIGMLKECLIAFWVRRGMPDGKGPAGPHSVPPERPSAPPRDDRAEKRRYEALELLRRAADLLADTPRP